MKRNLSALKKALQFGISGAVGGFVGNLITEPFMQGITGSESVFDSVLSTARWFGLVGGGIATAIMFGYYYYIKGKPQIKQALKNGGLFGLIAGAISGAIAEGIYSGIGDGNNELLRVICWGIAGSLLGLGLAQRIPNLGALRGLGGGGVGGVLGGCLFILFAYNLSGTAGRLAGCAAIGFWIGIMLVVAETLFNKAWLVISYDTGANRTLTLGAEPVTFGSDENLSIICIPNVSPLAMRFQLEAGQIVCENLDSGAVSYLRSGDQKRIGNCTITVGNSDLPAPTSANILPIFISDQPAVNSFTSGQFSLKLGSRVIPLSAGTQLFTSDIPSLTAAASNGLVAIVTSRSRNELSLGLTNLSDRAWWVTNIQGDIKMVEPETTLTLALGTQIEFGELEGEIV
ncbi:MULTISPECIES: FHA domain-containing protein [unclassified Microcoleus]|uniref:FHA domain-containing protein n=1 Tax=unclassified Microcoleus TaxID=2642155 RepID=UPI002FD691B3